MATARADPKAREPRLLLQELKVAQARAKEVEKSAFGGMFK